MKFLRRIMIVVAVTCLLAVTVFAADGTLTVLHTPKEKPSAEVAFRLYAVDGAMTNAQIAYVDVLKTGRKPIAEGKTDENGKVAFSDLEDGTYLLMGQSHYVDSQVCEPQMSLITLPGEDGVSQVTVQTKYTLKDPATEAFQVMVIWEENTATPPDSLEVSIWKNGSIYETVTLHRENSWQYFWESTDPTDSWTVSATLPAEYTVTYERDGNVFVVRCAKKEGTPVVPSGPNLPQTGQLWWPVTALAIVGLFLILIGWVRRKESRNEG